MPNLITTVGGATSNSYLTIEEANDYFDTRLPIAGWTNADEDTKAALLIMATRTLDSLLTPLKTYVPASGSASAYFRVRRAWTGSPASTTQRLAWPRSGMYDRNGNAIPTTVIPHELKEATAELAGQLSISDRTLDNEASVQGLKSVSAGSVSLSFKDYIEAKVLPDAVWNLLPPSWYSEEIIIPAFTALFDVIG